MSEASPLISICIPTYNQTDLLRKTFESIAIQSFKNFEVVVTDDSDETGVKELAGEYADKFKLVYCHNKSSLGSPANWNLGLNLASGKYIKMMHHDDWFASADSLAVFADAAVKEPDAVLFFCESQVLNHADNSTSYNKPAKNLIAQLQRDPAVLFNHNFIGAPSAVMFRNDGQRFDEHLKYLVDVEFYIRLLRKTLRFVYISKPLIVNTSNNPDQVTASSMNRETQLGEYSYLYNVVYRGKLPSLSLSRFFIYLFKHYRLHSLSEITGFGFSPPKPEWYFRLLLLFAKKYS